MKHLLNKTKALKALSAPLKFGDADQIEAIHWLEIAAELEASDLDFQKCCDVCDGTGTVSGPFDPFESRPLEELRQLATQNKEQE